MKEKWFQNLLNDKNRIIQELECQLRQKDEEIQFLVTQLDYLQQKYRHRKMQISVMKSNLRAEEEHQTCHRMRPERD